MKTYIESDTDTFVYSILILSIYMYPVFSSIGLFSNVIFIEELPEITSSETTPSILLP